MTTIHIFSAVQQPATDQRFTISTGKGVQTMRIRLKPRQLVWCSCCSRSRIAANAVAQVYYDMTSHSCKRGKGCR